MTDYLKKWDIATKVKVITEAKNLVKTTLKTEIAKEYPLENFHDGIEFNKNNMSAGKVLLRPF